MMESLPNIVLVHGAWADGSSWGGVIERLHVAGYHVTAVQNPLTSLADDVARTRGVLAMQNGPTVLVGHSYGGAVISELGKDAPNVVGLIYVAAFALDEGESAEGLLAKGPQPPGLAELYPDQQGFLWFKTEGFLKYFAPDVDPAQARVMEAAQKPVAAATFGVTFGEPSWRSFPTWYLVAEEDQVLPPDAQRLLAQRMGATVSSVVSSHVAYVSHPDVVADLIMKVAQEVVGTA